MNKADHKFHREVREKIDSQARQNEAMFFRRANSQPIFMPKRKKKK